ncbi:hypothetical protein JCM8208_006289, partial [Rhodotorula glutinis]
MSRRESTSSNGPTWQPGSRDSEPPFVYDERAPPHLSSSDRDDDIDQQRQPRALHRRTTSGDLRNRSTSSRTIRPAARRSSKATTDFSDDEQAPSDADDEQGSFLRSRSSSAERSPSRSTVESHRSSVAYHDFPSPPGHNRHMYTPSPTPSTRTVRRISSIEAEKRRREQGDKDGSWFASDEDSSGSEDAGAPSRPWSHVPFERESNEEERRRIEKRLEEQKKLREGRAPTSPHDRAAAFLAAVQTHQAERVGQHGELGSERAPHAPPSPPSQHGGHRAERARSRASHVVGAYFAVKRPVQLDNLDEDVGAQSDAAPERERQAQRLNAAHRERLRRGSRMHGRLRDGESLYDLEDGPLAEYFDGGSDDEEQERDRGRARSSRFSGSTSSSRPRRGRETERAGGPSIWPATLPKKVRTASEEAVIRSARLGPNDRVREHKALAWVKQHECLTAG